jgi:hypothetical protein
MIVQCETILHNNNSSNSNNSIHNNKDDIINVTKAAAKRSILMQITARAKAANGFHWIKTQGCYINVNKFILLLIGTTHRQTGPKRSVSDLLWPVEALYYKTKQSKALASPLHD